MVEIEYTPIEKLRILEVVRFDQPNELAKQMAVLARSGHPIVLAWTGGILFVTFPLEPTVETVVKDLLEGTLVFSTVQYALMPQYQPILRIEAPELGSVELPIVNVSTNPTFRKLAAWLKEFRETK
jgi:hypothetical protein